MFFNLNNQQYYCQYFEKHFSNLLTQNGNQYSKFNPDIAHFNNAKFIGYGFPNCHARKAIINQIFNLKPYYPYSMSLTKKTVTKFPHLIDEFIKITATYNRAVLKDDHGVGAATVYVVKNHHEVLNKIKNNHTFILQQEIVPLLYKGLKFDQRVFLLVVKEDKEYGIYTFQESHIKCAGVKFDSKNKSNLCFATNIKAPKVGKIDDYIIDLEEFLKNYSLEKQNLWKNNVNEVLKEVAKEFLPYVIQQTNAYFKNKKEPKYLWHLYGLDIILNENFKVYLLEFNGKPGVIYDKVMPKHITKINRIMLNRIYDCFLKYWIKNQSANINSDKTIKKLFSQKI